MKEKYYWYGMGILLSQLWLINKDHWTDILMSFIWFSFAMVAWIIGDDKK